MQNSWSRVLSLVLLFLLVALPVESLPQRRKKGGAATGAATGAAAGGAAGAAATKITQATDGSMILDKTVQIK
ncbi:hypothetical protein DL98DRAFT_514677 [Cadophora sp. DSE1049]|nr:hypothetical protein DL98DRAFT_514677 [Cadophora sp. DSE1049]